MIDTATRTVAGLILVATLVSCASPERRPPEFITTGSQHRLVDEEERAFVICLDGTWNTPSDQTNVWHVFEIARERPAAQKVIPAYITGVGTTTASKLVGGKKGIGATKKTRKAYRFLCDWWKPGDSITIVGFSRGAYQARLLAGVIDTFGIHRGEYPDTDVPSGPARLKADTTILFDIFTEDYSYTIDRMPIPFHRDHARTEAERTTSGRWSRRSWEDSASAGWKKAVVDSLVCFDTVAAIAKLHELDDVLLQDYDALPEHLRRTPDSTRLVLHAMALDERRRAFGLVPFPNGETDDRVKQVWFAGGHSDIGGGYEPDGLNRNSFSWVLANLPDSLKQALGIETAELEYAPLATLHDETDGLLPIWKTGDRPDVPGSGIHHTVRERLIESGSYSPARWVEDRLGEVKTRSQP